MRRLMILVFTFVAFHDVNCETSQTTDKPIKDNVETTYHPHQFYISNPGAVQQHQAKDLFYYNKDLLTANQGQVSSLSSKQTPSTVLYREDSGQGPTVFNYPHYQTIVPQRPVPDYNIQTIAGTSHVPLTTNGHGFLLLSPVNQHAGYYQPTNQYSVVQPFVESSIRQPQVSTGPVQFYNAPAYSQLHLPAQPQQPKFYERPTTSFQNLVQHSNQQITQQTVPSPKIQPVPVETPKQTAPVSPSTPNFQFKTPLLFQHQVYHPLRTSIKHPQEKIIHRPNVQNPPTPPRIYKVFTPMIPRRVIPVTELPVQQQQTHNREVDEEEENEDKAAVNEEEEDDDERENENIEEDDDNDHSDVKEEDHDDEDDFRPRFRFSGKYRHHDDDDEDQDDDHHRSHYRHHDDDDHDSADTKKYSKNIKPKSKLASKYKYPKNFAADYTQYFNPSFHEHKARPGPDFQQPKVEVKMYKYTRSSNEPQKTEYIEGKGSELKPVIQHNQKTYQSKWIISTKTSSSTN